MRGLYCFSFEVHLADDALHQPDLVVVVVDREIAVQRDARLPHLAPQNTRADRVIRPHRQIARRRADQRLQPLVHLARGLVGEGHRQDAPRLTPSSLKR